jgi:putative sigma-54 modulation protein
MQIFSKNLDVTDALRVYIDDKIGSVHKLHQDIISTRIDLSRDTHHRKGDVFRVEVNLNIPKKLIRVVERKGDAREAIDLVAEKLARQLRVVKSKKLSRRRKLGRLFKLGRT